MITRFLGDFAVAVDARFVLPSRVDSASSAKSAFPGFFSLARRLSPSLRFGGFLTD